MVGLRRRQGAARVRRRLSIAWTATLTIASVSQPQHTAVTLRVLADADDSPLANAEVIDRTTGAHALTRETGEALVRLPVGGALELRVRQLRFAFVDLTLRRSDLRGEGAEPVIVRLTRIPFALPALTTTAASDCPPTDTLVRPLAFWALRQLREGAERYEAFRKVYPFRVAIERRTVVRTRTIVSPRVTVGKERTDSDRWGERNQPGAVVKCDPLGYSLSILFIATLGDPVF